MHHFHQKLANGEKKYLFGHQTGKALFKKDVIWSLVLGFLCRGYHLKCNVSLWFCQTFGNLDGFFFCQLPCSTIIFPFCSQGYCWDFFMMLWLILPFNKQIWQLPKKVGVHYNPPFCFPFSLLNVTLINIFLKS